MNNATLAARTTRRMPERRLDPVVCHTIPQLHKILNARRGRFLDARSSERLAS